MKTIHLKAYAKVNLFLDIVGTKDGFHMLDTVVTSINLFDEITISKRKDKKVVLRTPSNLYFMCDEVDNNAYKAGKLFVDTFDTNGADITVKKNIPIGSGLGGSSADIAGVLAGLKKLYEVEEDVKPLADMLGSDSGYMLTGGYARLTEKGNKVELLDIDKKMYMVVITAKGGVNTTECYKLFDTCGIKPIENGSRKIIQHLADNQLIGEDFYNALYVPATMINENVKKAYETLKGLCPTAVLMSGSGSSVYAVFDTFELCMWAYSKVKYDFKDSFVTETLSYKELNKKSRSLYSIEEND